MQIPTYKVFAVCILKQVALSDAVALLQQQLIMTKQGHQMIVSNEPVRLVSKSSYAERNFSISRAMRLDAERRKWKKKAIIKSDFTVSKEVIDDYRLIGEKGNTKDEIEYTRIMCIIESCVQTSVSSNR